MRRRRERAPAVPACYRRYVPGDWPGGPGQWAAEREAWARAQPAVLLTGRDSYGRPWAHLATPLGDETDMVRARRESRMIASAEPAG